VHLRLTRIHALARTGARPRYEHGRSDRLRRLREGQRLQPSLPAQAKIEYTGSAGQGKLHVLAIGINKYEDQNHDPSFGHFDKLEQAVPDAKAFADEMEKAGAGLYSQVQIWPLHDEAATAAGLDAIFKMLAAVIEPRLGRWQILSHPAGLSGWV